jgi:geranylgeranylglycerol-phosphate geranylgeranyltransferase
MEQPAEPVLLPDPPSTAAPGVAERGLRGVAFLRLVRAENCVMAGLATLVGAGTATAPAPALDPTGAGWAVAGSAVTVMLVVAFGNVLNDLADEAADTVGKSRRPLPSGRVSRSQASGLAWVLLVGAVAVTLLTPHRQLLFVAAMGAVAALYSPFLKRVPLLGNLTVAGQCGATLLFGAGAAGAVSRATVGAALLVAVGMLCVEVAKTVEDHDADRRVGTRTVAHLVGAVHQPGLVGALAASYLVVWAVLWPAAHRPMLFALAAAPIIPLLAFAVLPAGASPATARVPRYLAASKWLWPLALVALTGL